MSKCKVMHSKPFYTFQPTEIKLGQSILESVMVYKYIGFHNNPSFDSKLQWNRVQQLINPNIHLLKQIHSGGLRELILLHTIVN